jgi:hypothetical protein
MMVSCPVVYNKVVVNFVSLFLLNFGGIWLYSLRFIAVQNWLSALVALCLHKIDFVFALIQPSKLWNHALMFINDL